jgi:hypothetical protein
MLAALLLLLPAAGWAQNGSFIRYHPPAGTGTGSGDCDPAQWGSPGGDIVVGGIVGACTLDLDSSTVSHYSSGTGAVPANGALGDTHLETDALLFSVYANTNTPITAVALPAASGTPTDDNVPVGTGTAWAKEAIPDCQDTDGKHLNRTASTNAWSCGTSGDGTGGGGVTLAGLASKMVAYTDFTGAPEPTTALTVHYSSDTSFRAQTSVAGGVGIVNYIANHPGVWQLSTMTSATGLAQIYQTYQGFGDGALTTEVLVRTGTLSDGTEGYALGFAMLDVSGLNPADGCGIQYEDSNNAGEWECYCRDGGSGAGSTIDTNIAVVGDTWYKLRLAMNTAGTSLVCSINGAAQTAITTNIPADLDLFWSAFILKTSGTTARTALIDYAYIEKDLSR